MKKKYKLNSKEIVEMAYKIGKPVYKLLNKQIEKEFTILLQSNKSEIDANDFTSVILLAIVNMDSCIFKWLRDLYKQQTGDEMDMVKLLHAHISNLTTFMTKDEMDRLKQKMN